MRFKVNEDVEKAAEIRKAIKENDGYCPCKVEHLPENKCVCDEFLMMNKSGWCHCGLYYKNVEE